MTRTPSPVPSHVSPTLSTRCSQTHHHHPFHTHAHVHSRCQIQSSVPQKTYAAPLTAIPDMKARLISPRRSRAALPLPGSVALPQLVPQTRRNPRSLHVTTHTLEIQLMPRIVQLQALDIQINRSFQQLYKPATMDSAPSGPEQLTLVKLQQRALNP
jgi:hypothetical protein